MKRLLILTSLLAFALQSPAADDVGRPIRVAVYQGPGAGPSRTNLLEVLGAAKGAPGLQVAQLNPEAIRNGELKQFDVLIHPGGSGGSQGRALEAQGREEIREFVRNGGGFVGICAGAYLATDDYEWSLGLIEARVVDKRHWARGIGTVEVELSPTGKDFFGTGAERFAIHYAQGPLLSRQEWDNPLAPEYESLGIFRTGMAEKGAPEGIMPGTSAIVRATFEKGRVFVFSPHPEMTEGLGHMVERAVHWAARRDATSETNAATKKPQPPRGSNGVIERP